MQHYLNPLAATVDHRTALLGDIERKTSMLNEDFDSDTVEFLKDKIADLEETNRILEERKDLLKRKSRCCECRPMHWVRGVFIGVFATALAVGISRLGIKYSQDPISVGVNATIDSMTSNTESILGDVETYLMFIFGAVGSVHELMVAKDENSHRQIHEASMIEKFGEESFDKFLSALQHFKTDRNKDQLKDCIQTLDDMPMNRINESLVRQKLIPVLLNMLPEENEVVIQFNRLKEDGRRVHFEVTSIEPKIPREGSSTESGSNPFAAEKSPLSSVSTPSLFRKNSVEPLSPLQEYQLGWRDLETELGVRFDAFECDGHIFRSNGLIEEVIPAEHIVDVEQEKSTTQELELVGMYTHSN